jgi:phenylacetaldehyde dehydrogenase
MSAVFPLNPRLEALRMGFLARDHGLFVDGRWAAAQSGQSFDVLDPATGARLARAAAGEAADVDCAVKAARKAFQSGPWPRLTHAERAKLVFKLAAPATLVLELAGLACLVAGGMLAAAVVFDGWPRRA